MSPWRLNTRILLPWTSSVALHVLEELSYSTRLNSLAHKHDDEIAGVSRNGYEGIVNFATTRDIIVGEPDY